uniref:Uncharacterized protein n=1 Tax=Romanomermis culicivorax TaxID=13658 RepID=A0A915IIG3_ROMCU
MTNNWDLESVKALTFEWHGVTSRAWTISSTGCKCVKDSLTSKRATIVLIMKFYDHQSEAEARHMLSRLPGYISRLLFNIA